MNHLPLLIPVTAGKPLCTQFTICKLTYVNLSGLNTNKISHSKRIKIMAPHRERES